MKQAFSRPPLAVTLTVLMTVAACGGDSSDAGDDGPPSISTTATDFVFVPDAWVTSGGDGIAFTMGNEGSVVHSFAILDTTIDNEDEFSEDQVIWRTEVESGATASAVIDVTLPPETYQVICTIETHFDLGMEGKLIVNS